MPLVLLIVLAVKVAHRPAPQVTVVLVQPAVEPAAITPPKMAEPIVEQKAKTARQEQADNKFSRTRTLEETKAINTGEPALVSVAVTPWGEVYLDGRMQGVSPPLAELRVTPGKHEIEIRNTTFPVYRQSFQVKAGGQIKIKHKFNN